MEERVEKERDVGWRRRGGGGGGGGGGGKSCFELTTFTLHNVARADGVSNTLQ